MTRKFALLLAGGSGLRAGGSIPKQFRVVNSRPILWYSLKAFHEEDPETRLIVVLHPDYEQHWKDLISSLPEEEQVPFLTAYGGKDRPDSVANGLKEVEKILKKEEVSNPSPTAPCRALIAVHDGARPMVSRRMIAEGWQTAAAHGAAVPAIPLTDSIRRLSSAGDISSSSRAEDRSEFVAVQTPQVFDAELLLKAYAQRQPETTYTDDASVVEPLFPISLFPGDPDNIKVTHPKDFNLLESIFSAGI